MENLEKINNNQEPIKEKVFESVSKEVAEKKIQEANIDFLGSIDSNVSEKDFDFAKALIEKLVPQKSPILYKDVFLYEPDEFYKNSVKSMPGHLESIISYLEKGNEISYSDYERMRVYIDGFKDDMKIIRDEELKEAKARFLFQTNGLVDEYIHDRIGRQLDIKSSLESNQNLVPHFSGGKHTPELMDYKEAIKRIKGMTELIKNHGKLPPFLIKNLGAVYTVVDGLLSQKNVNHGGK